MKEGLMPISQWALHFYEQVAYHDYDSLALDYDKHGSSLVKDLGNKKIIFLRNHGMIACGQTIHEAMFYCYHLEQACKTQIAALSTGYELLLPGRDTCRRTNYDLLNFEEDLGKRDWEAWVRFIDGDR